MRKLNFWPAALLLLLVSCSDGPVENQDDKTTPTTGSTASSDSPGLNSSEHPGYQADEDTLSRSASVTPEVVVQQMIKYADAGDYNSMQILCDSAAIKAKNTLCGGNTALFKKLAGAKLTGGPNVEKITARVPIYLRNGEKPVVMLAWRKHSWYISAIENIKYE
jgi:hypothetical protein